MSRFVRSPWARAVGAVLLANACFLALSLVSLVPRETVERRIQTAFAAGELVDADYLPFDARRGWHQYNDCLLLQLLSNENPSPIQRALAPAIYTNAVEDRKCAMLRALVTASIGRDTLVRSQYARYWHGSRVPVALGLRRLELAQVRTILAGTVWCAILVLALVAYKSGPRTRLTGLGIAVAAATVWAVPYFAPGLTHGPGDAALLLGLAVVIAWPRLTMTFRGIVPYAAAFGCVIGFFDMLTGQLPIAAAWLAALTLASNRDQRQAEGVAAARGVALMAFFAFAAGACATILVKQAIAVSLTEPGVAGQFASNLRLYMSVPDYEDGWPGMLEPFGRLFRKSGNLTYGNAVAGYAMVVAMVVAWLAAAIRGWQTRDHYRGPDRLVILSAALIPVVWTLVLPNHTYIHAGFMVRILVVPLALAPVALFWPTEGREVT